MAFLLVFAPLDLSCVRGSDLVGDSIPCDCNRCLLRVGWGVGLWSFEILTLDFLATPVVQMRLKEDLVIGLAPPAKHTPSALFEGTGHH